MLVLWVTMLVFSGPTLMFYLTGAPDLGTRVRSDQSVFYCYAIDAIAKLLGCIASVAFQSATHNWFRKDVCIALVIGDNLVILQLWWGTTLLAPPPADKGWICRFAPQFLDYSDSDDPVVYLCIVACNFQCHIPSKAFLTLMEACMGYVRVRAIYTLLIAVLG